LADEKLGGGSPSFCENCKKILCQNLEKCRHFAINFLADEKKNWAEVPLYFVKIAIFLCKNFEKCRNFAISFWQMKI